MVHSKFFTIEHFVIGWQQFSDATHTMVQAPHLGCDSCWIPSTGFWSDGSGESWRPRPEDNCSKRNSFYIDNQIWKFFNLTCPSWHCGGGTSIIVYTLWVQHRVIAQGCVDTSRAWWIKIHCSLFHIQRTKPIIFHHCQFLKTSKVIPNATQQSSPSSKVVPLGRLSFPQMRSPAQSESLSQSPSSSPQGYSSVQQLSPPSHLSQQQLSSAVKKAPWQFLVPHLRLPSHSRSLLQSPL